MGATGWMSVEIDETPVDIAHEEKGPLDEEPVLNSGIASALQLGLKKGNVLLQGASDSCREPFWADKLACASLGNLVCGE